MSSESYTWNAEGYANHSTPQQQWAEELLSKLHLEGNEQLLDIGCGDGKITARIARMLPEGSVLGIDSSAEMTELARSSYPRNEFPNLHFRQMDARYLPFENEFDVVFSNAALHWIRNHDPILQGTRHSLKLGGRILLQMGGKGNAAAIFRAADRVIQISKWSSFFKDFTSPYAFYEPEEYRKWLLEHRLEPHRVELIPKQMYHENPTALGDWLQNVFLPYTERVPPPRRRDFIQKVVDQFLEQHPVDEQGRTHVQMMRLEVEARAT